MITYTIINIKFTVLSFEKHIELSFENTGQYEPDPKESKPNPKPSRRLKLLN